MAKNLRLMAYPICWPAGQYQVEQVTESEAARVIGENFGRFVSYHALRRDMADKIEKMAGVVIPSAQLRGAAQQPPRFSLDDIGVVAYRLGERIDWLVIRRTE